MRHTVRIRMVVVEGKNFRYTQRRFLYIYMYVFIPLLRPSSSFLDTIKEESMRDTSQHCVDLRRSTGKSQYSYVWTQTSREKKAMYYKL